jgi:tryptophan synthase alpha chain
MKNRIDEKFAQLRAEGRKAFIPYITAGDPTLDRTRQLVLALERAGADIIELGIPFSDPLADGKTNQAAAERALKNNVTLAQVIDLVRSLRQETQIPIIFFTYLNPVFQYGFERFGADAAEAGIDGVLALDQPPEEAETCKKTLDACGVKTIFLIAPTSTEERIRKITAQANGFIYYVSRTGVTGERETMSHDIAEHISLIRKYSDLPVAVGFGISKPEHVTQIAETADGVVVGSAIVHKVGDGGDSDDMVADVESFVASLSAPLRA